MRLTLLISVSFLFLTGIARAQTADDFFNSGAQLYISNNIPSALEKVESGLKIFPDDTKLKKLEELLKQQSQNNQSQQNQKQNRRNQSSQSSQKNQNSNSQPNQSQPAQQNSQPQQNQPQKSPSQPKNSGEKENNETANATAARAMTPQEAKQLLDSQKGDEQFLQLKPKGPPENSNGPIKDW